MRERNWQSRCLTMGRWAIPFCMVAILAGITGCKGDKNGQAAKQAPAAVPPPVVVVAEVIQKTVPIYSEFVARTDAQDTVEIRARVQAFLEQQHFTEGTMVEKGQLLFTLDKREYEAQLQQARAQLAKAEADVESARAKLSKAQTDVARYRPLAAARAVPQQDLDTALAAEEVTRAGVDQARAAIDASKAAIAQAELNISYCTIRSPIDGLIGKRDVAPGNLVGRGEATLLATVSRLDPLRVFLSISEADYLRLMTSQKKGETRAGAKFDLLLADGSVFPHKGRMIIADRAVDVATGTLSIIAEFPNPEGLLRPGQFGRALVAAEERPNAILVPQRAVQEIQGAKTVLVVGADNMVALRTITPAETVGEFLIVRDGVKPGERVIVEGIQKARPGTKVEPSTAPVSSQPGEKAEAKTPGKPGEAKPTGKAGGK